LASRGGRARPFFLQFLIDDLPILYRVRQVHDNKRNKFYGMYVAKKFAAAAGIAARKIAHPTEFLGATS
jgi:hypothetical protein